MISRRVSDIVAWSYGLQLLPFTLALACGSLLARLLFVPILLLTQAEPAAAVTVGEASLWTAIVVGPVIETALFQALPIRLIWALGGPRWLQLMGSLVLFALAHQSGGAVSMAAAAAAGWAFAGPS